MIHKVNTRTFNLQESYMLTNRAGTPPKRKLEQLQRFEKSLYWSLAVEGKNVTHLYSHVLASEKIAVTQFSWRDHVEEDNRCSYYVDIIDVTENSSSTLHLRDLYLDLLVFENRCTKIDDTDELIAAFNAGYISKDDMCQALETTHHLLNKLAEFNHSLKDYLVSLDIHLTWDKA